MTMLALLDWLSTGPDPHVTLRQSNLSAWPKIELSGGLDPKPKTDSAAYRAFRAARTRHFVRLDKIASTPTCALWVISEAGIEWLEEQRAKRTKVEG